MPTLSAKWTPRRHHTCSERKQSVCMSCPVSTVPPLTTSGLRSRYGGGYLTDLMPAQADKPSTAGSSKGRGPRLKKRRSKRQPGPIVVASQTMGAASNTPLLPLAMAPRPDTSTTTFYEPMMRSSTAILLQQVLNGLLCCSGLILTSGPLCSGEIG